MVSGGGFRLGVDFGTTNTVAALAWPDGTVRPLIFDGSPTLPSAVYRAPDGDLLAGRDALHGGRVRPESLEPNPKRCVDDTVVLLGAAEVPVRDLIAAVLRRVGAEAGRVAGFSEVVLTCPATWGARRRQVLLDAAADAGLGPARLVAEPVAAAAWFASTADVDVPVGGCIVVYDFGAGTFDASAVRRDTGGFTVLAEEGLRETGGLDVDAAIVSYLGAVHATRDPQAWQRLSSPASAQDLRLRRGLWDDVRAAKEALSRAAATELHLPIVDDVVVLGREQLEQLARPLVERTVATTAAVIRAAGLTPPDVHALFLVGGSSRLPLAATMLHQRLRLAPTVLEQPELVVAQGSLRVPLLDGTPEPPAGSTAGFPPAPTLRAAGPTAAGPMSAPASAGPMSAPVSAGPMSAPVSGGPMSAPTSAGPMSAPVSGRPVSAPVSGGPVSAAPVSGSPSAAGMTEPSVAWPAGSDLTDPVPSPVSPAATPVGAPTARPAHLTPTAQPADPAPTSTAQPADPAPAPTARPADPAPMPTARRADPAPAPIARTAAAGPMSPLTPTPAPVPARRPAGRLRALLVGAVVVLLAATGVWYAISRDDHKDGSRPQQATGAGCAPVAGEGLVALTDDRHVLRADNIVPVMPAGQVVAAIVRQLDLVSATLDTRKLAGLNRRLEVDGAAPAEVAQEFAAANGLTKKVDLRLTSGMTIGTTKLPEQQVVAHLYRISLEAAGYHPVIQVFDDRAGQHAAMVAGTVSIAPEYAGSYAAFLNDAEHGLPNRFATADFNTSTLALLGGKAGLTFGATSPAASQDVFAVSKAFAERHRVTSLDEFARACSGAATVLAAPADCPAGYPCRQSLVDVYALHAGTFTQLPDRGAAARAALAQGTASLALLSSTDPAFA
ncbi:Hsp70 family protein [Dactylosporangium sp. NPDC005555]|uniref:Hsp70 family protein n=1 Tax=Dactylosporangium sp. NPDC005555 TaxID=3154889 RepID=UPI0033AC7C98